jgi:hypothetical protein
MNHFGAKLHQNKAFCFSVFDARNGHLELICANLGAKYVT